MHASTPKTLIKADGNIRVGKCDLWMRDKAVIALFLFAALAMSSSSLYMFSFVTPEVTAPTAAVPILPLALMALSMALVVLLFIIFFKIALHRSEGDLLGMYGRVVLFPFTLFFYVFQSLFYGIPLCGPGTIPRSH